jgi:putative membrane protein
MKIVTIIFAFSLLAACHKENNTTTLNGTDQYFLQKVSYANHNEIAAGQIATTLGTADSVKFFGQMTVTGYTSAQSKLDSLAGVLQLSLPQAADSSHLVFDQELQNLSGLIFDTTYMGQEVRDHQILLVTFNDEISYGNNLQVKSFANEYLPMIEVNLQMAQRIYSDLH